MMAVEYLVTDDPKAEFLRALNVGGGGVGKTTSIRTLPKDRTLVAVTERSAAPLAGHGYNVARVKSWTDWQELCGHAVAGTGSFEGKSVFVLDTLNSLNELCKLHILKVARPALLQRQEKKLAAGIYDEQLTQQDWGLLSTKMSIMLQWLTSLPMHIIVMANEQWTEDKGDGGRYITPALNGKLAIECPRFFDLVLYMQADKKGQRTWRTSRTNTIIAKDAWGKLDELEETDWTKLIQKLIGNGQAKTKKEAK